MKNVLLLVVSLFIYSCGIDERVASSLNSKTHLINTSSIKLKPGRYLINLEKKFSCVSTEFNVNILNEKAKITLTARGRVQQSAPKTRECRKNPPYSTARVYVKLDSSKLVVTKDMQIVGLQKIIATKIENTSSNNHLQNRVELKNARFIVQLSKIEPCKTSYNLTKYYRYETSFFDASLRSRMPRRYSIKNIELMLNQAVNPFGVKFCVKGKSTAVLYLENLDKLNDFVFVESMSKFNILLETIIKTKPVSLSK